MVKLQQPHLRRFIQLAIGCTLGVAATTGYFYTSLPLVSLLAFIALVYLNATKVSLSQLSAFSISYNYCLYAWFFDAINLTQNVTLGTLIYWGVISTLVLPQLLLLVMCKSINQRFYTVPLCRIMLFISVFTLAEYSKSLLGFPWAPAGYQLYLMHLSAWLPLIGMQGMSLLFYAIAVAIGVTLRQRQSTTSISALAICTISFCAYLWPQSWTQFTQPSQQKLRVQLLNENHHALKDRALSYNDINQRINIMLDLVDTRPRADLSLWPEAVANRPWQEITPALPRQIITELSAKTTILLGTYQQTPQGEINALTNLKDGKPMYIKQRLIPFAEYLPAWFQWLGLATYLPESSHLTAPASDPIFSIKGIPVQATICSEIIDANALRQASDFGLIAHIADLGWFADTAMKTYLFNLLKIRALEHQKPLLSAANHNISAIINHQGQVLDQLSQQDLSSINHLITPQFGNTLFSIYGDYWLMAIIFMIFLLTTIRYLLYKFMRSSQQSR